MDEETLLERFEDWHIEEHGWFHMNVRVCAERWAGFKAHAECCPLVVELPRPNTNIHNGRSDAACEALLEQWNADKAAIEAAGGRVAQC